jgi:hypothetical protein
MHLDWNVLPFVIIVLLTAMLLVPNGLYAVRRFLQEHNLWWFACYLIFLLALALLLVHVTRRTVEIVMKAKEVLAQPDIG